MELEGKIEVSVYATADGYKTSDRANATIYWLSGDESTDDINLTTNKRGIMVSKDNGITIYGLDNNEVVTIYTIDGVNLGSIKATQGTAHLDKLNYDIIVLKIKGKSIKITL